jgi:hypothetical protein
MSDIDTSKITRFEVINITLGRVFVVPAGYVSLTLSVQDEGRRLRVFLKRKVSDDPTGRS